MVMGNCKLCFLMHIMYSWSSQQSDYQAVLYFWFNINLMFQTTTINIILDHRIKITCSIFQQAFDRIYAPHPPPHPKKGGDRTTYHFFGLCCVSSPWLFVILTRYQLQQIFKYFFLSINQNWCCRNKSKQVYKISVGSGIPEIGLL